jgi:hypothetical protein
MEEGVPTFQVTWLTLFTGGRCSQTGFQFARSPDARCCRRSLPLSLCSSLVRQRPLKRRILCDYVIV